MGSWAYRCTLISGGTTLLSAAGGPLVVSVDRSAGPVTAVGESIDLVSLGALTFAELDANRCGQLSLADASATGDLSLRSTGGALAATGTIDAGGSATLEGQLGVSVPTLISGGTTLLSQPAARWSSRWTSRPARRVGESIDLVSLGALTFAELDLGDRCGNARGRERNRRLAERTGGALAPPARSTPEAAPRSKGSWASRCRR
jgi:hypothetical protein